MCSSPDPLYLNLCINKVFADVIKLRILRWDHSEFDCWVTKSCPTLCNPMGCSTPDFPVLHCFLKLISIESVTPSNHLILCRPLLLLPSIFPSITVFSNESALCIRCQSIGVSASTSVFPMNNQCRVQLDNQGFQQRDTAREWETRHKNSEKSQDQRTNTAPRLMCWNWIQASFIILSAVNERICGELNYNSCGLQGQRTKWSLTIE